MKRDVLTAHEVHMALNRVQAKDQPRTAAWFALNRAHHAVRELEETGPPPEVKSADAALALARDAVAKLVTAKSDRPWTADECAALAELCRVLGLDVP